MKQINISMKEYIPVTAKNIRITWDGEYNCNGDLIRLDSITIWFDSEEEEPLSPMSIEGKAPEILAPTPIRYIGSTIMPGRRNWVIRLETGDFTFAIRASTRDHAIIKWNELVKKLK